MARIAIRNLKTFDDLTRCVFIQKQVWPHEDVDVTPVHQFRISIETGAVMMGAFLDRLMVGFVYGFPAIRAGRLGLHSHLLAVLPEHRGLGLGKRLKWAQREEALRRGYKAITWTFDPLQARNASLNLHTLGAFTRTYLNDFYGPTPALMLGPGIPTDRLLVEWPIRSKQVELRKTRRFPRRDPASLPRALDSQASGALLHPARPRLSLKAKTLLVEVPRDIAAYTGDVEAIAGWQAAIRTSLRRYFARGYRAIDVVPGERFYYVLER